MLAVAAATLIGTLTIAGFVLANLFENSLEQTIEQQLDIYWSELAAAFELTDGTTPNVSRNLSDPRFHAPFAGAYWRIDEGGQTLLRSRSLWDQNIVADRPHHLSPRGVATEQRGPNESTVYVLSRPVTLTAGGVERTFELVVALDTADMEELRAKFGSDLTKSLAVIGLMLFAGAMLQASYGLAPLRELRRRLSDVHSGAAARLAGAFPEEVAPLVDDLNGLIGRQEDLVRRARHRAGDLAHGLKTPLTVLQSLERRRREAGDVETADLLREQVEAMRAHIERELSRARTHGKAVAGGTLTDAASTVLRLISLISRAPGGDRLTWDDELPEGLRLRMDPDDFGEVMGNLLDNARKAARDRVRIAREMIGGDAFLVVDDDGPGIAPERVSHLLGRGVSEDATAEGSGLGLSIVTDILDRHHMALHLEAAPLGGCRARFGPLDDALAAV